MIGGHVFESHSSVLSGILPHAVIVHKNYVAFGVLLGVILEAEI